MTVPASAPLRHAGRLTAVLALLVIGLYGACIVWPQLFVWMGFQHFGVWFLDSYAILASLEAVARGVDPYAPNPLDVFGRPHVYSHWWLWLGSLGLTRADNLWVGLACVLGFLATAFTWLRPRCWREVWAALAIFGSAPVLLACNRANNDLLIFVVLAAVVPCLMARNRAVNWLAVGAIALATGLKYYPAAAALLLLAERNRGRLFLRVAVMLLALGLVAFGVRRELMTVAVTVPQPDGFLTFGARFITDSLPGSGAGVPILLGALLAAIAVVGWRITGRPGWAVPEDHRREHLGFILGAALLTGCFWTNLNYAYRWIFSLWLLPWLWRGLGDPGLSGSMRHWMRWTLALLFAVLWLDTVAMATINGIHHHSPFADAAAVGELVFILIQPFHWAFFFCLTLFLLQFLRSAWAVVRGGMQDGRAMVGAR